jgi:tRNA A37 threonylcarbamoyladenosine dehydratase
VCVKKGLKVLSATGAGARVDPTRIRIADLKESSNDPLSRSVSLCPTLVPNRARRNGVTCWF